MQGYAAENSSTHGCLLETRGGVSTDGNLPVHESSGFSQGRVQNYCCMGDEFMGVAGWL